MAGQRLLPSEPLVRLIDLKYPDHSDAEIGGMLGITGQAYLKLRGREVMQWTLCDKYAIKLGYHPVLIWEDWYEATALPGELGKEVEAA